MIKQIEFDKRRAQLIAECLPNSLVIVPAATAVTRSNDTEYHFRQNSDFWYFTGFNEPDAFFLISNRAASSTYTCFMFVRPKDPHAEIWHGRRLGVDAAPSELGLDACYDLDDIEDLLPEMINGHEHVYFSSGENPFADTVVLDAINSCKSAPKQSLMPPRCVHDVNQLIHRMRRIKSDNEIAIMQRAADISAQAHCRAMQAAKAGVWEYQLEADILHTFAHHGAKFAAYNTIVGGGGNACILHYVENNQQIADGELVLIDAGCELYGYAADITRTFPVNGKFTPAQAQIYQLVLDAQLASIPLLRPDSTITEAMDKAVEVITHGLINLGIILETFEDAIENKTWRRYFMHGLGHYLGLDVHDVGIYKQNGVDVPLKAGIVMTVEPGIYIAADATVPNQYKGIGVRIEDNIVITPEGNKVLSDKVPKTIDEIEALIAN